MTSRNRNRQSRSGVRLPLWGLGLLVLVVLVFLIVSSFWLFRFVLGLADDLEALNPDFGQAGQIEESSEQSGEASLGRDEDEPKSIISNPLPQKWSGSERVNTLLLGIDQRCDEDGPTRTDTMMVLTIDPVGLSAAALSLPRDLWVEIPTFGVDRINQANFLGELYEYPGGGPGLAVETVEAALGISIDYYVTVNFDAFVQLVDQVGGIEIVVPETIDDESYPDNCYGYDPFYIEAGQHELDGLTALKYARTRATFGGDVDRAARQQQVVLAVRDKVLKLNMAPQLLTSAPEMWRIFQENVETNLSLNETLQLALLAQDISRENIRTEVLNYEYVYNEVTPDGQAVLVPVRDKIRVLRDQLFAPPAIPTPVIEDLPQIMNEEQARVAVHNGTQVFGLAGTTRDYLLGHDINVVEVGNADSSEYRSTQVIDFGSHPGTALYLTQLMNIPPLNISSSSQSGGEYDILVILGGDWQVPEAD
ncbi:MAG TPA: LCP family protein [Anaerolineae bacterium]|jgi:LCP family protein required for cell wall assembly|nr:LCP family protein [Anaerolineae bacterium]